jgi:hypothetical protein
VRRTWLRAEEAAANVAVSENNRPKSSAQRRMRSLAVGDALEIDVVVRSLRSGLETSSERPGLDGQRSEAHCTIGWRDPTAPIGRRASDGRPLLGATSPAFNY